LGFKVLTPVFDGADDTDMKTVWRELGLRNNPALFELEPGKIHKPMNLEVAKKWVDNQGYHSDKVFNEKYRGKPRTFVIVSG